MITANEARLKAQKYELIDLNKVTAAIEAAASKGEYYIHYNKTLPEAVLKRLKEKGFTTQNISTQRDGSYCTIRWE